MIVAVTGGTGFIGRRLVAKLMQAGHEVRVLSRQKHPKVKFSGAQYVFGDLSSSCSKIGDFLAGADVVCHLAAELHDEGNMHVVNVEGTNRLLQAVQSSTRRWVQLSSTGVYGSSPGSIVKDDAPIRPGNAYEISKANADRLIDDYTSGSNTEVVFIRPSNVYGPDMPNQSLFQLISIIDKGLFFFVGKPGAVMNYIHVDNVVDALLAAVDVESPISRIRNRYIVSDYSTIEEVVSAICLELDKPVPRLRLPHLPLRSIARLASIVPRMPLTESRLDAITSRTTYLSENIETDLLWRPRVSVDEGFRELATEWKKKNDSR